jgi:hypothetical protein
LLCRNHDAAAIPSIREEHLDAIPVDYCGQVVNHNQIPVAIHQLMELAQHQIHPLHLLDLHESSSPYSLAFTTLGNLVG